jgi:hypothetical protein
MWQHAVAAGCIVGPVIDAEKTGRQIRLPMHLVDTALAILRAYSKRAWLRKCNGERNTVTCQDQDAGQTQNPDQGCPFLYGCSLPGLAAKRAAMNK